MIVADTSFLLSFYLRDAHLDRARRALSGTREPLVVSPLARLEFTNGLKQQVFRSNWTIAGSQLAGAKFEDEFRLGRLVRGLEFTEEVWKMAESLSREFSARLGTRSLDVLHVAGALLSGGKEFWSFDDRQRALARATGLELNA